jgi:hypothetical protein
MDPAAHSILPLNRASQSIQNYSSNIYMHDNLPYVMVFLATMLALGSTMQVGRLRTGVKRMADQICSVCRFSIWSQEARGSNYITCS